MIKKHNFCILTLLLIAAFLVALLPVGTARAATQRTAALDLTSASVTYAGGTGSGDPTSENILDSSEGWKWYYNGDDAQKYNGPTLVLNGLNLVTASATALKLPEDATVVLASGSTNTVTSTFKGSDDTYGILFEGDLLITDSGSLTAKGGTVTGTTNYMSFGIRSDRVNATITISGGAKITAYGGGTASEKTRGTSVGISSRLILNSGSVTGYGGHSIGLDSIGIDGRQAPIVVSGGTLEGIGGSSDFSSIGIFGPITLNGGKVTATGNSGGNGSYGIENLFSTNIVIKGGTLIAQSEGGGKALDDFDQPGANANIDLSGYSGGYRWRTSKSGAYTASTAAAFSFNGEAYIEIAPPAAQYTVTLVTNGGTVNSGNITGYVEGEGATLPSDVTQAGYTFGGWYANSNFTGSPVTAISASDKGNKTFYAKWNEGNAVPSPSAPQNTQTPEQSATPSPSAPANTQSPSQSANPSPSAPINTQNPEQSATPSPSTPANTQNLCWLWILLILLLIILIIVLLLMKKARKKRQENTQ